MGKNCNWELTINNPTKEEIDAVKCEDTKYTYITVNKGNEEHTEHAHVLLCYENAHYFNPLKEKYPRAHIDVVRSTKDYMNYLTNEHEEVIETWTSGVRPLDQEQKGKKMKKIWKKLIKYATRGDIEKIAKKYPSMYALHYNKFPEMAQN